MVHIPGNRGGNRGILALRQPAPHVVCMSLHRMLEAAQPRRCTMSQAQHLPMTSEEYLA